MKYYASVTKDKKIHISSQDEVIVRECDPNKFLCHLTEDIDTNSSIRTFTFQDNILHIETFAVLENGTCHAETSTIEFIEPLDGLEEFFEKLKKTWMRYNEVKDRTDKNVEQKIIEGLSFYLKKHIESSILSSDITKDTAKIFLHYMDTHRNRLMEKLSFIYALDSFKLSDLNFESISGPLKVFLGLSFPFIGIPLLCAIFIWPHELLNIVFPLATGSALLTTGLIIGKEIIKRKIIPRIIKKYDNYIDAFRDDLTKTYSLEEMKTQQSSPNQEEPKKGLFVDFIEKDIAYISNNPNNGAYDDILKELINLLLEYRIALNSEHLGNSSVDKFYFLSRLLNLEKEIYAKDESLGLIQNEILRFDEKELARRLEFLNSDGTFQIKDFYLKQVENTMVRILSTPYRGYEQEILALLDIAQEYAQNHVEPSEEPLTLDPEKGGTLLKRLNTVELIHQSKLARAQKINDLRGSVHALQTLASTNSLNSEPPQTPQM